MNNILAFYHPNGKCTGGAIKFELVRADRYGEGKLLVTCANQISLDEENGKKAFPRFDWTNSICVKMDITETAKIIGVLRGEVESINDGMGLISHSKDGSATAFRLRHIVEPTCGYSFEVAHNKADGTQAMYNLMLTRYEGLALQLALESAIGAMAWG